MAQLAVLLVLLRASSVMCDDPKLGLWWQFPEFQPDALEVKDGVDDLSSANDWGVKDETRTNWNSAADFNGPELESEIDKVWDTDDEETKTNDESASFLDSERILWDQLNSSQDELELDRVDLRAEEPLQTGEDQDDEDDLEDNWDTAADAGSVQEKLLLKKEDQKLNTTLEQTKNLEVSQTTSDLEELAWDESNSGDSDLDNTEENWKSAEEDVQTALDTIGNEKAEQDSQDWDLDFPLPETQKEEEAVVDSKINGDTSEVEEDILVQKKDDEQEQDLDLDFAGPKFEPEHVNPEEAVLNQEEITDPTEEKDRLEFTSDEDQDDDGSGNEEADTDNSDSSRSGVPDGRQTQREGGLKATDSASEDDESDVEETVIIQTSNEEPKKQEEDVLQTSVNDNSDSVEDIIDHVGGEPIDMNNSNDEDLSDEDSEETKQLKTAAGGIREFKFVKEQVLADNEDNYFDEKTNSDREDIFRNVANNYESSGEAQGKPDIDDDAKDDGSQATGEDETGLADEVDDETDYEDLFPDTKCESEAVSSGFNVTLSPASSIFVEQGLTVSLECIVVATSEVFTPSAVIIEWHFQGVYCDNLDSCSQIIQKEEYRTRCDPQQEDCLKLDYGDKTSRNFTSKLELRDTQRNQTGLYRCIVGVYPCEYNSSIVKTAEKYIRVYGKASYSAHIAIISLLCVLLIAFLTGLIIASRKIMSRHRNIYHKLLASTTLQYQRIKVLELPPSGVYRDTTEGIAKNPSLSTFTSQSSFMSAEEMA